MKALKLLSFSFFCIFLLTNCDKKANNIAKISEQGHFEYFPDSTKKENGDCCLNCETSAVVYYNKKIFMAIDKVYPNHSPVFYTNYSRASFLKEKPPYQEDPIFYAEYNNSFKPDEINIFENKIIQSGRKYEDFTLTPDNEYVLLSSAFDRINSKNDELNSYNTLLYWNTQNQNSVKLVSPFIDKNGNISSKEIHQKISKILFNNIKDENYFKVEGLAAIPGNKLLFGIREQGKSYTDFDYCIKILQTTYTIENNIFKLNNDFTLVYNYQPDEKLSLSLPIGLSSIEYDKFNDRLYLLTSFEHSETDSGVGAYLWTLPIKNFQNNQPPTLILKENKKPLLFTHKSEGITVIDKNTVFIINDDDRILGSKNIIYPEKQFSRKPNQSSYYIASFKK